MTVKVNKPQKDQKDRLAECVALRMQMRDLQIDDECGIVHQKMQDFVKHGIPASGRITIKKLENRPFVYMLSNTRDSQAALLKKR